MQEMAARKAYWLSFKIFFINLGFIIRVAILLSQNEKEKKT